MNKRILYTDHNPSTLDQVQTQLREKYDVQICKSGLESMLVLEKEYIDMVVLDLGLPDGVSSSVCPMFKKHSKNKDVFILIIVSEKDGDLYHNDEKEFPEGVSGIIKRPFDVSEMVLRISVALGVPPTKLRIEKLKNNENNDSALKQVNHYRILELLGKGGNSSVFLAIDESKKEEKKVALKLFKTSTYEAVDSSMDSFFLREAYGMSKLDHRNVVKMFDFGKFKDTYYLAIELINGRSLETIVSEDGPLEESQLILVAAQVCSVLMYLQDHNVIHRDIKPANILVESFYRIKLTDFGASKQLDDNTLTRHNEHFMGTPQFVSPEQIVGDTDLDIRCDVYSLGATLYYCGTSSMPFTGKDPMDILYNNVNTTPKFMNEINPKISIEFATLVSNMLEKKRDFRAFPHEIYELFSKEE